MSETTLELMRRLPRPLAFVLGGGGSRGAVQLGMLQAIAGTDLVPDLVVGTSAGSLNGAVLAADPACAVTVLEDVWGHLGRHEVFPGGLVRNVVKASTARSDHLFDSGPLSDMLAAHLPVATFEELEVPFIAVATDLDTGVCVEMNSGPLLTALLASSAIPAAFPWVKRDGRRLVDGGLVNNIPVRTAFNHGAKSVLVLDCGSFGAPGKWSEGILGVLVRAYAIASRQQITADLLMAADYPVVYMSVPDEVPTTVFDFSSTANLAAMAREANVEALSRFSAREFPGGLVSPGLYGHPPLSILNPTVSALRKL